MAKEQNIWEGLKREVPAWFRDAKFGLFFHWGPYSVPAYQNEWYSRNMYGKGLDQNTYHEEHYGKLSEFGYKDFYDMLKGEKFDPEEWADMVVRSGAKYAGPVCEHGDNFSMWDSKVNPNNCMNYGIKRDVAGECAAAFRRRGIRYLSPFHHQWLWGWFMSTDPEADCYLPENEIYYGKAVPLECGRYQPIRLPDEAFCITWRDKVLEVIEKYAPDALYFDSRVNIIPETYRAAVARAYYQKCPDGTITYKQEDFPAGLGVFDIERGRFSAAKEFAWQVDDRAEDCVTWCHTQDVKYRTPADVIHQLCDIVSKNGNLLLNVGPREDGTFEQSAKDTLYAVGDWLKVNGEAVYGTRPFAAAEEGPTKLEDSNFDVGKIQRQLKEGVERNEKIRGMTSRDIRFTAKGGTAYAILMGWPADGRVDIRCLGEGGVKTDVHSVEMLGCGEMLAWTRDQAGLHVVLPKQKPCNHAYSLRIR